MQIKLRNRKYFQWMVTALLLTTPLFCLADDLRFTASASNTNATVGDQIQITFQLEGSGRNFQAPNFADFNLLMGPSQSTQMQIVNGSISQTISYTYIIQAVKEGTFKIAGATIEAGGKKVQSNGLTITVAKGGNTSQQQQQGGGSQQKSGGATDAVQSGGKNVYFKVSVDKSTAFRGEGIIVTYRLYTKVDLVNYSLSKMPSLEGFFSQEISLPQQIDFRIENVDGVNYRMGDIKKFVLFPQRSGTLTLDPMEGEVVARMRVKRQQQQSKDPFDQFFNDPFFNNPFFNNSVQDIPIKLKSEPIRITVKELPEDAPSTFNGAVGKFSLETTIDKQETKAHDPITLKIKVSGKGNLKLLDPPRIEFPPDFETYDPKVTANVNATTAGVSGSKTFEYLVIPRNAGDYKLTVADFSFFNLEKKKYESVPGSGFALKIGKGDESMTTTVTGVIKSDVQFLGKDIRFIKTSIPLFISGNKTFYNSPLFYSLCAVPAIFFLLLLIFRKRYVAMQSNVTLLKSRKANKVAMKRLSSAKKFLAENKTDNFLDEMFRALWGFVSDKLQIPVSGLSKENVAQALKSRKVSEESVSLFIETLDACELARFAKGIASSNEEIYRRGIEIISKLEEEVG